MAGAALLVGLPAFGDAAGVREQIIENVRGEDGLTFELAAQIVTDDDAGLLGGIEVERDHDQVELDSPAHRALDLILGMDGPVLRQERLRVAVDDNAILCGQSLPHRELIDRTVFDGLE